MSDVVIFEFVMMRLLGTDETKTKIKTKGGKNFK